MQAKNQRIQWCGVFLSCIYVLTGRGARLGAPRFFCLIAMFGVGGALSTNMRIILSLLLITNSLCFNSQVKYWNRDSMNRAAQEAHEKGVKEVELYLKTQKENLESIERQASLDRERLLSGNKQTFPFQNISKRFRLDSLSEEFYLSGQTIKAERIKTEADNLLKSYMTVGKIYSIVGYATSRLDNYDDIYGIAINGVLRYNELLYIFRYNKNTISKDVNIYTTDNIIEELEDVSVGEPLQIVFQIVKRRYNHRDPVNCTYKIKDKFIFIEIECKILSFKKINQETQTTKN